MTPFYRTAVILALAAACFIGAGCNTWEGFGKDVEDAGESIQDSDD